MLATTTNSRERETQSQPHGRLGWRDFYKIHPAAEVFPLLSHDELQKLARDIDKNGLKIPIQTRAVAGEASSYVIDGRNRLDAMESLGWQIVNERGEWIGVLGNLPGTVGRVEHRLGYTHEKIAAEVIAFNIQRRHLSRAEQVTLIDAALKAASNDSAKMARSFSPEQGKRGGSTKDIHRAEVIKQAAKAGISKRTVERVTAKTKTERAKPKPQIDRMKAEYVVKKFQQWLERWTSTEQRVIRKIVFDYLDRVSVEKIQKAPNE